MSAAAALSPALPLEGADNKHEHNEQNYVLHKDKQ
jgi:hypothetical protein